MACRYHVARKTADYERFHHYKIYSIAQMGKTEEATPLPDGTRVGVTRISVRICRGTVWVSSMVRNGISFRVRVSVRISLLRLTCEHTTTDIQQISALRFLPTILQHFSAFYQQHRYALSTKAADKQYLSNTLFQNTLSSENVLAHIREFHCNAE